MAARDLDMPCFLSSSYCFSFLTFARLLGIAHLLDVDARAYAAAAASVTGSGVAYLQQKRAEQQEREHRLARTSNIGEEIHQDLARITIASRLLSPQDPQLTRYAGTMVLNGAYLVDIAADDRFQRRVRELAAAHPEARIESGGPWPPYSFAVLEQT